jgi:hypothetical protein
VQAVKKPFIVNIDARSSPCIRESSGLVRLSIVPHLLCYQVLVNGRNALTGIFDRRARQTAP